MPENIRFIPDLKSKILNVVSVLTEQQNWGLAFIDAEGAWKHTRGENTKVAVIDTGWFPHKDLQINFFEGHDATGNNDFMDHGNGHGTHVAGIIAANCGDAAGIKGVVPNAKLIPIKALDDDGTGSYDFIANALKIAHDIDVDVINMSLGSSEDPGNDTIHSLIKDITSQGKIVICASGNDGAAVNYPAKYDEAIAVAAVQSDGTLAKFSSRGSELDTAAPGVHIYSTWLNNKYINLDGTSMAAPTITGIVALMVSWYKANPDPVFVTNYQNMIKLLQQLGGAEGEHIIQAGEYNIGVPKFINFDPWKV